MSPVHTPLFLHKPPYLFLLVPSVSFLSPLPHYTLFVLTPPSLSSFQPSVPGEGTFEFLRRASKEFSPSAEEYISSS